ncbi:hypothetical protein FRC12_024672 [Ceratobasidium sp. 428]|nr:hypothetical protein FRC12_024672 [Ceratobasidium sp. 428]
MYLEGSLAHAPLLPKLLTLSFDNLKWLSNNSNSRHMILHLFLSPSILTYRIVPSNTEQTHQMSQYTVLSTLQVITEKCPRLHTLEMYCGPRSNENIGWTEPESDLLLSCFAPLPIRNLSTSLFMLENRALSQLSHLESLEIDLELGSSLDLFVGHASENQFSRLRHLALRSIPDFPSFQRIWGLPHLTTQLTSATLHFSKCFTQRTTPRILDSIIVTIHSRGQSIRELSMLCLHIFPDFSYSKIIDWLCSLFYLQGLRLTAGSSSLVTDPQEGSLKPNYSGIKKLSLPNRRINLRMLQIYGQKMPNLSYLHVHTIVVSEKCLKSQGELVHRHDFEIHIEDIELGRGGSPEAWDHWSIFVLHLWPNARLHLGPAAQYRKAEWAKKLQKQQKANKTQPPFHEYRLNEVELSSFLKITLNPIRFNDNIFRRPISMYISAISPIQFKPPHIVNMNLQPTVLNVDSQESLEPGN